METHGLAHLKVSPLRRRNCGNPAVLPAPPSRTAFPAVRVHCIDTIKKSRTEAGFFNGADTRTRTADPLITNQ